MPIQYDKAMCSALLAAGLFACSSSGGTAPSYPDSEPEVRDAAAAPETDAELVMPVVKAPGAKGYIGLFGDGAIAVLDMTNMRVLTTIPLSAPDGMVITPDGKQVFVASADTGSVKVIETEGDTIRASLDVGPKPAGLAITPDGKRVVVAVGGGNEAVIIDTQTLQITRRVPVGQAHAACITSDGHYAYVGSQVTSAPAVIEVDLLGDEEPKMLPVDKSPRMLACEANGIYFSAVGLDAVELLDPESGMMGAQIDTGGSPHDLRAGQLGKTELVVSQTAGDLEIIDIESARVIAKVPTGKLPHWITLSADRSQAYVTNEGDNNLVAVDLAAQRVVATVALGKAPRKMVLRP